MQKIKQFDILDVKVSATNLEEACFFIANLIEEKRKSYICVAPVSTIVDCQNNSQYREIVNRADMVTPDGMPTVWIGRRRGHKNISRVYGPDLMLAVCRMSQDKGYTQYFYGATPETCRLLEWKLKEKFPRLSIVGKHSPPFRELSSQEDEQWIEEVNRCNPDIVWVGLGSPKQDFWMHKHRDKLKAPVMIGVGAAFDFLSGVKPQAPKWMQQGGLEWFFRLCSEPKRLGKRYLIGNSKFIYFLLCDRIKNLKKYKAL